MALYYAQQFATTKLSVGGGIDASQTTGIVLQSVTGIDTAKAGILCLSWSDPIDTATYEYISYTSIDGSNELQGVTRGVSGSTGRSHLNEADVAWVLSEEHINNLNDAFKATHTEAGVHSLTAFSTLQAPEGFLLNGKIVPSVASNNLTVAIKGVDGNDPSASNPVYAKINGAVRSITAALSVTKNAGTNWCNSGGAELATMEVDYFVYLGYNATDGVVVGFSRISSATSYGEFSATTTNEKHCAISTITTAAATDYYNVIGRFAATLSAGAGYTWTVPTFTASNLVQRPVFETRWLSYVPTLAGFSSNPTSIVAQYRLAGNLMTVALSDGGNGTSNTTGKTYTLPLAKITGSTAQVSITTIVDNGTQAYGKHVLAANSATVTCYPAVATANWTASGSCRLFNDGVMHVIAI